MKIKLIPHINKTNGQIGFNINKTSLPKKIKDNIKNLKEIKIDTMDFKFNEFEEKWKDVS